ncbi:MAG: DUF5374 domain-containing protein [Pasteurellaceae bacterium]|nr:DUF5374 domain-containing protein [Pasteurellaceae bacterium]
MNKLHHIRGMSTLSLLVCLALFSLIVFTLSQWSANQRQTAVKIYQVFQAIQIIENQKQRLFLGMQCESVVWQNQLRFNISCAGKQVSVSYPMGKLVF